MCMHTLISYAPPTSGFHYRDTLALTDDILPRKACILAVYYECHRLIITRTNLLGSDVTTVQSKSLVGGEVANALMNLSGKLIQLS